MGWAKFTKRVCRMKLVPLDQLINGCWLIIGLFQQEMNLHFIFMNGISRYFKRTDETHLNSIQFPSLIIFIFCQHDC